MWLFAKMGANVTRLDVSPGAIRVAQRRAVVNGVSDRMQFVCAPAETAGFAPDSFDVVWAEGFLHHVLDELELVRRYIPDLSVRHFGLLGRLDLFVLTSFNYERSTWPRRAFVNVADAIDYEMLSMPLARNLSTWARCARSDTRRSRGFSVTDISLFSPSAPTATPTPTPTATPGGAPVEVTPGASGVTASTSDVNVPANTVDNNLSTRWSGNGDGAWIQYDLGTTRTVTHVNVAVYNGNSRQNTFDIQVSTGGGVWNTVWSGQNSGTTTAEETCQFADVPARWVRYLGHGSTATTFNSVSEVSIFAIP